MRSPFDSILFNDDERILRLAKEMGVKVIKPIEPKTDRIEVDSKKIGSSEFRKLGGGFIKHAHKVWKLTKESDKYFLERMEDEEGLEK